MIEVLKYYARCNYEINTNMIEIIQDSDKKPYEIPVEGYFKSIRDILDHCFIALLLIQYGLRHLNKLGILIF
jgi:hypothetical protein